MPASGELTIGFLPLVDACLPILAREHGFAEAEGLSLSLVRDMSWATVLDRLLYGHSHAAHLVAPLAIATTLGRGRGRPAVPLSVPFVLGLNGNAITLRPELADRVAPAAGLGDPRAVGNALRAVALERKQGGNRLRFGVVHRYSSQNYTVAGQEQNLLMVLRRKEMGAQAGEGATLEPPRPLDPARP